MVCPYFAAMVNTGRIKFLYILSLSLLCDNRDFMIGSREKYTLFAKISLSCVSTSSSAVMLTDFIQGFS